MSERLLALLTGNGLPLPLLTFVLLGAVILVLGSLLARAADEIAETSGLGRAWIGVVLLAASTSLPEVATGVNAALLGLPDIGVGDLLGASLANLLILATLDLVFAQRRILQKVAVNHAVVGALAICLIALAGTAIAAGGFFPIGPVGLETLLIAALYLAGMRFFYQLSHEALTSGAEPRVQLELGAGVRTRRNRAIRSFVVAAAVLAGIAPLVVVCAEAVSLESGLSQTFVGTLLVGLATSLPEIAATVAAVRMGALDLAVGNVFGSIAFNMLVLLLMDLAYRGAPLLASVSGQHVLTAQLAVLCTGFGIIAIMGRLQRKAGLARVQSVLIVLCYAAGIWLLA